jgi:hypothetical protein
VEKQLSATVVRSIYLPGVPSGSAIEFVHDTLYIIGDDARYIYECDWRDGRVMDSLGLIHLSGAERRIPKPVKPDYEAAVAGRIHDQDCILAFGSGSLQPQRDSAVIIALGDSGSQRIVPLDALYSALRKAAGIAQADFNIEAAALQENRLVLINRGTNHLFSLDWDQLLHHLLEAGPVPPLAVSQISLPKKNGYPVGISGACFRSADQLIFCASVEATTSWVTDGEVLGSYFGVITFDADGSARLNSLASVVTETGTPVKDKLEGIISLREEKGILSIYAVVDNDDGSSKLLQIAVKNLPAP